MLDRSLSRRTVLERTATAGVVAGGLGVADRATDDPPEEHDEPDPDCDGDAIDPDVAVVGARAPDADAAHDADYVATAGDALTFDASETTALGAVDAFAWDFGSETAAGERVHHAYERGGGVATVTLSVTDGAGRSASTSVRVAVESRDRSNRAPTPVHDVSPARTYDDGYVARVGERLTFDARDSTDPDGDVVGFEWRFRRGAKRGAVVEHAFRRAGNYEVTLVATDDDGASERVEIPIHVTR